MEDVKLDQIVAAIGVLAQNQEIINSKIDAIINLYNNQEIKSYEMQNVVNQQSMVLNSLSNEFNNFKSQLSDIQINIINNNDTDTITSAIRDVSLQIDDLSRKFDQWKFYSDL